MADPKSWDVYWRGVEEGATCTDDLHAHAALDAEWMDFFKRELADRSDLKIADLACGTGAVARNVAKAAADAGAQPTLFCADFSHTAAIAAGNTSDFAHAVAADCRVLPFADQSIDIVASQFGVEYAGPEALQDAARLVAPAGVLYLFAHWKDGAIFKECKRNEEATRRALETQALNAARDGFRVAAAAKENRASQDEIQTAQQGVGEALQSLGKVANELGADAAGGLVAQLYNSLMQMFARVNAYALQDTLGWCDTFEAQAHAYIARMETMQSAALDEKSAQQFKDHLTQAGFALDPAARDLCDDNGDVIALRIAARRQA